MRAPPLTNPHIARSERTLLFRASPLTHASLFSLSPFDNSFFGGGMEAGYQRFRTTSQNFYDYDTKALAVGESNQGIVSEKSKIIHKNQLM